MARSNATGEHDPPTADALAVEEPLQPVRAGGPGRPIALTLVVAVLLAALVWQPWGSSGPKVVPSASTSPGSLAVAVAPSVTPPEVATPPAASPTPSLRGPRPSFGAGGLASATYVSLGDNEWSVVGLLAPVRLAAADQSWAPDPTGALEPPGGPLLVLQLEASWTERPIDVADDPAAICRVRTGFRYYLGAHLPANRVAYLGVTVPGMDARARVTGAVLGKRGLVLKRLPVVKVRLSGMPEGVRYTVPTAGSGGAALFALAPRAILPVATYRFDIQVPGVSGHRYLYACIDP
jgi:hypothetical protein